MSSTRRSYALQVLLGSLIASPEFVVRQEKSFLYVEDLRTDDLEYQTWKIRHWRIFGDITRNDLWKASIVGFVIPDDIAEFVDCERISTGQTGHLVSLLDDLGLAVWFMEAGIGHEGYLELPLPVDWTQFELVIDRLMSRFQVILPGRDDIYLTFDEVSSLMLKEVIFPYVVPSKRYKFGKLLHELHDISKTPAKTAMQIQKVGIRQVPIPLTINLRSKPFQTVATASVYTSLQPEVMGSHLSRLVEILNTVSLQPLVTDLQTMQSLLSTLQERLKAPDAYLKLRFPILLPQKAPVSQIESIVRYDCTLSGELIDGNLNVYKLIRVPYMSACICSKTISLFNAHCQRSFADITVLMGENDIDYEDLIEIVEDCCSAPIRALLKREDEKFVTESSYDHAAFVETTSRAIAEKLEHLPVRGFSVLCEHEESLHQHNAVAVVRGGKEYVY